MPIIENQKQTIKILTINVKNIKNYYSFIKFNEYDQINGLLQQLTKCKSIMLYRTYHIDKKQILWVDQQIKMITKQLQNFKKMAIFQKNDIAQNPNSFLLCLINNVSFKHTNWSNKTEFKKQRSKIIREIYAIDSSYLNKISNKILQETRTDIKSNIKDTISESHNEFLKALNDILYKNNPIDINKINNQTLLLSLSLNDKMHLVI